MRKLLLLLFVFTSAGCLFPNILFAQNRKASTAIKSSNTLLNGCWKRIAVIVNGKAEANPLPQYRLFHDGFYTINSQDSTHAWKYIFGGTYEISKDIYIEKTMYSSFPGVIGNTHWQEIRFSGDTVSFKLFKKQVNASGKEIPAPAYTRELVCVRVKKMD